MTTFLIIMVFIMIAVHVFLGNAWIIYAFTGKILPAIVVSVLLTLCYLAFIAWIVWAV